MTLKQFYDGIGGDYENVTARFGGERLVNKFIIKFLDDPTFKELENSLAADDCEGAFRAAHTLKGLCLNLGFAILYSAASDVCEALRAQNMPKAKQLFPALEIAYHQTIAAIEKLKGTTL